MKRILLLSTLFLSVFLSNCKKENDPQDLIVGKWKVTRLISNGIDAIQGDDDYRLSLGLEFTNAGSVVFDIKTLDLTTLPPEEENILSAGSYSWSGDNVLTLTVNDSGDILSVTGTADVTANRLIFTATSGDTTDFLQVLEADKL